MLHTQKRGGNSVRGWKSKEVKVGRKRGKGGRRGEKQEEQEKPASQTTRHFDALWC